MSRVIRGALLVVQAFVAVTAAAGGVALILGSVVPTWASVLVPPRSYLDGSPFDSYLAPGLVLLVVVGGVHLAAFVCTLQRSPLTAPSAAAAGFVCLIWIFVQMVYIPFSFLQVVYFATGLLQVGLTLLTLGVFDLRPPRLRRSTAYARGLRS